MKDTDTTHPAEVGHNRGPIFDEEIVGAFNIRVHDFTDAAACWKEDGKIETREQADKANDFLAGGRKLIKEIEDRRKLEKQPYLDSGAEVDKAFKTMKDLLIRAALYVKPLAQTFLREEQARLDAQREVERKAAAEAEERAAADLAAANTRNDIVGQQEAEEAAKAAEKAAKKAAKPQKVQLGSTSGGGKTQSLRTIKTATITNINSAMLHYRNTDEMHELIVRLAQAEVRHAKGEAVTIPGIKITETKQL